jgi:hypothetical protein
MWGAQNKSAKDMEWMVLWQHCPRTSCGVFEWLIESNVWVLAPILGIEKNVLRCMGLNFAGFLIKGTCEKNKHWNLDLKYFSLYRAQGRRSYFFYVQGIFAFVEEAETARVLNHEIAS